MKKKIFSTLLLVAFTLASTSMFVSCKDYDDDINANKDRISKLETTVKDLQASVSTLESCCSTVQGEIDALKSGKADKADLEELSKKYGELSANLVKLEERVQALEDAKKVLEDAIAGKASQADLDALRTELAGIDQKIADALEGYATINYVDAAKNNLQAQIDVFEKYRQALLQYLGLTDDDAAIAKVKEMVENLKTAVSKIGSFPADDLSQAEIDKIRQLLQNEDGEVNKFLTEANVLQFLLTKQLTGLVAYDMSMIGGVEHLEVPAMYFQPVLARVGEGYLEEFHYINPNTNEIFEADKFGVDETGKPKSAYLFDAGEMAPKASLGGVHSWKDFATKYGEGDKNQSVLSFYETLVSEFTRLKTAQLIAHGTFKALTNPSSVDLSNTKFNFFTDTRIWGEEVESREGKDGFAVPMSETVNGKEIGTRYNDGVVEVDFTLPAWEAYVRQIARTADGNYVKNPFAPKDDKDAAEFASLHDSLNWVSLQAQVGEVDGKVSTVSSDFVVVTPSLIHVQALADNEPEAKILDCHNFGGWTGKNGLGGHLWKTAREAIDVKHPATHSVPFDAPYVDILPFIETHFTNLGFFMKWTTYDKKMEADMFKQLGLQYNFELVDYEDGVHETGETKHMTMKANYDSQADFGLASVQVTARSVDAQGNTKANEAATREAIDREPLMRVELLAPAADHNGNRKWDAAKNAYVECTDGDYNVIEIGYIKFIITDHFEPTFVNIEMPDYYMNCDDEQEVTWAQVEALILAKIGVNGYTKAQFESEYGIVDDALNVRSLDIPAKSHIDARQWYFESETNDFTTDVNPKDGNPDNVKPGAYLDAHATGGEMGVASYCSWDKANKQTNVLRWMIAGDAKREAVMMYITGTDNVEDAREILISREGIGLPHHDLITTVKFVKKGVDKKTQEMTAVYVNLIIPGEKVHFAYADANRKDLSHWYELNSWKNAGSNGENAIEVHMNYPTENAINDQNGRGLNEKDGSAGVAKNAGDNTMFWRNIFENYYHNDNKNVPDIMRVVNPDHFDKFAYQKDIDGLSDSEIGLYKAGVHFRFVLPKKGVNAEFDANADGTWTVYGYSGRHKDLKVANKVIHPSNPDVVNNAIVEYTLHITADGKEIRDQHDCLIASIQPQNVNNEVVEIHANKCANDILNYAGRFSDNGVDEYSTNYFTNKRTFTAYSEVFGDETCYPILIGHRHINFKFMRPLNAWAIYKLVKDGVNVETKENLISVLDMTTVVDWRRYLVEFDNGSESNGDFSYTYKEYNGKKTEADANFENKTWPEKLAGHTKARWFGVQEVIADVDNILTDHARTDQERIDNHALIFENKDNNSFVQIAGKNVYNQEQLRSWITNHDLSYDLITEVPGFKSSFDWNRSHDIKMKGMTQYNEFAFFNNKDNVQLFHYFIPVYIKYAYGEYDDGGNKWSLTNPHYSKPATLKVWVVVTCVNTKNNPDKE